MEVTGTCKLALYQRIESDYNKAYTRRKCGLTHASCKLSPKLFIGSRWLQGGDSDLPLLPRYIAVYDGAHFFDLSVVNSCPQWLCFFWSAT